VTTLREDFPAAAAVFAECFTRPTFPDEEFQKVQTLALGAIARRAVTGRASWRDSGRSAAAICRPQVSEESYG
jgi:hypothetical protein